jgi:hypothetical protein
MPSDTFVGFPHGQGDTGINAADVVKEIQPVTTWSREGGYTVTRRWRGPIDALVNFSEGGASNADFDGIYFNGASGILPGGAGRDGAISTNLERDDGGQTGTFSATWITSNIASALGNPRAAGRTGTSGDQYQESSLWFLDGNDLEKNILECPEMEVVVADVSAAQQKGFAGRVQDAVDLYKARQDKEGNALSDPFQTAFDVEAYFDTSSAPWTDLTTANKAKLKTICDEMLKGVEAFTISQYVLRNTIITQYDSGIGANALSPYYANVNQIWDTSDITAMMTAQTRPIDPPTSAVAFTLPLIGLLTAAPFTSSKWLYRTPDVQQLGNGKWQITREWWETTDYSTVLYTEKP